MNNNEDSLSSAPQTPRTTRSLHSKRRLLILIGVALALLLLALTYVYWYQNPKKVVSDAFLNVISAKTVNYAGVVQMTGSMKMNTTMDGGISPKGTVVNAKFTFDTQNKQYTLTGNGLLDANGDAYVKIKDINELIDNYRSAVPAASLSLFDKIIDKIDDKWIKISAADIKNYNADFAVIQKCSSDAIIKIQDDTATKSTLLELYKNHPFVAIDKTLGVKGDSLGYSLKIDHDESKSFTTEYKKTTFYKNLVKCDKSYVVDKDIAKQSTTADGVAVDVWVSRWSHILTKVDVRDEKNKSSTTNLSIETKFNQPVTVEAPKNATTLEKLQNDVQDLLRSAQTS
jgi:hypothetical protein